ncbi:MAG: translation initiation factor [Deltaproteobacteria bacterium]
MQENKNPFSILNDLKFEKSDINDLSVENNESDDTELTDYSKFSVRIWLEKKHRNGKPVSLITGIDLPENNLKELARKIKTKMGTGGSVSDNQILIQSQNRDLIITILKNEGFRDIKKAGG